MAPMLAVPEVSFSQPASFSLLLQILQQALLSSRCNLPKNRLKHVKSFESLGAKGL